MPLILITGLPCSGKTELAQVIEEYFVKKLKEDNDTRKVRIVTDFDDLETEGRDFIYSSIEKEKEVRGRLKSEAQRYLNRNQIIILDAAAYIKGYRYEIYCMCKEAKTQYCVVEKLLDPEVCWQRNELSIKEMEKAMEGESDPEERGPDPGYKKETFDALVMRYEKCDESNRWDSPLFRLTKEYEPLDLDKVYDIIVKGDPLVPNKCTSLTSTTTTIYKPTKE